MEKYYVKAPISGWHEVNKEHFEAFVGNMRKHSTPPTMTIDELIARKTRIVETGGKPVARDWPPAPDDGRLIMMEEQWIKSKPQWNGCALRRQCR